MKELEPIEQSLGEEEGDFSPREYTQEELAQMLGDYLISTKVLMGCNKKQESEFVQFHRDRCEYLKRELTPFYFKPEPVVEVGEPKAGEKRGEV